MKVGQPLTRGGGNSERGGPRGVAICPAPPPARSGHAPHPRSGPARGSPDARFGAGTLAPASSDGGGSPTSSVRGVVTCRPCPSP